MEFVNRLAGNAKRVPVLGDVISKLFGSGSFRVRGHHNFANVGLLL
jgi:hypothetical protein